MRLLPMIALLAFAAVPAAASAAKVDIVNAATGKKLANKSEIKGESSNLKFKTEAGTLECSKSVVTGELKNNNKENITGTITTASFTGEEAGGLCKTTGLGPAKIVPTGLPWTIVFTAAGTTTIEGTPVVDFEAEFPAAGGLKCDFQSSSVADSFEFEKSPLIDTISKQTFTSSSPGCPTTGELNGSFTLTSKGEALEALH